MRKANGSMKKRLNLTNFYSRQFPNNCNCDNKDKKISKMPAKWKCHQAK